MPPNAGCRAGYLHLQVIGEPDPGRRRVVAAIGIAPAGQAPVEATQLRGPPLVVSSRTIVRITDVVSEGPVRGLVDGLSSVFFDDTPVVQPGVGTANFSGITVWERLGYPDQNPVRGFPAIETNVGVGARILKDQPVVRTITNANVDAVRVRDEVGQGFFGAGRRWA